MPTASIAAFFLALVSALQIQMSLDARAALHTAFENRGAVRSAYERVREAERASFALGAFPLTRLESGVGTRPDVSGGEDLTLFQPLDLFGKARASRRVGNAGVAVARADLLQALVGVQQDALTSYAQLASAQHLLVTAQDQRAVAKGLFDAAKVRVEARSLPEIQLIRADLELQRAEQLVVDRRSATEAASARLQAALGVSSGDFASRSLQQINSSWIKDLDLEASRPELLALSAQIRSARSEKSVARLSNTPDFEIQARRSPWADDREFYGARIQMVLPLWDHGAARAKTQAADFRLRSAEFLYADRLLFARKEREAARLELAAAEKSVQVYQKLADGASALLIKIQRGFAFGASTLLDVLDARRAMLEAQESLVAAQLRLDLAVEAVLRSQGQLLEQPK